MLRKFALCLAACASAMCALAVSARADSFTTRIETRPYYGAVVTLEHGVRVFRPLPPDRYVVINPDRVPLSLSISETNIIGQRSPASYDGGYGNVYTGDGLYHAPAWSRAFQWRPGFYRIGGPRRGLHPGHHGKPHTFQPAH